MSLDSFDKEDGHQTAAWMRFGKPFIVFLAVGVTIMVVLYGYTTFEFVREPLVVSDLVIERTKIRYGEDVILSGKYQETKQCLVTADHFIFREPENLLVKRDRLPSGMANSGETIKVPIQTAGYQPIGPGHYRLRILIHSDCGYRLYTFQTPDLEFEITE